MTDGELITQSLELLETSGVDIIPGVYRRFYGACPAGKQVFDDYSELVHGKMVNELVAAVLDYAEGRDYIDGYLEVLIIDHNNYGVTVDMYDRFFEAVLDELRAACGSAWTDAMTTAWRRQFVPIAKLVAKRGKQNE